MRGRMRSNTCRIVLLTSLVWVIFDFVLIARYSDCIGKDGWRCKRSGEYDVELPNAERLVDDNQLVDDNEINTEKSLDGESGGALIMGQGFASGGISMTYPSVVLKKWFLAPKLHSSRAPEPYESRAPQIPQHFWHSATDH